MVSRDSDRDGVETAGLGLLKLEEEVLVEVLDISVCERRCDGSHCQFNQNMFFSEGKKPTHPNLLLFARITSLHDSHQVGMLSLLLGLGTSPSRARHIHAILGHDLETRDLGLGRLLGLFSRLFGNTMWTSLWGAEGPTQRFTKGGRRRRRRRGEHGWAEAGRLGVGWALVAGIWESNIISPNQSTGQEVNGSMVEEVDGHLGEFVLLVGRTRNKSVNQDLELLGAQGRLELERGTQERLGDGEGGKGIVCHCFQLQLATFCGLVFGLAD